MNLVLLYLRNKPNKTYVYFDKDAFLRCSHCGGRMRYNSEGIAQCEECKCFGVYM